MNGGQRWRLFRQTPEWCGTATTALTNVEVLQCLFALHSSSKPLLPLPTDRTELAKFRGNARVEGKTFHEYRKGRCSMAGISI